MLRRAVACFLSQTYPTCELVILHESDDAPTRAFVTSLNEPRVRGLEVAREPTFTLGALRNLAIAHANGSYLAQWDDDDWHAPTRVAEQLEVMRYSDRAACVLLRWQMFDQLTGRAYVSQKRLWEGSLLALKDILPPYPDLPKGEDTPVVVSLFRQKQLATYDKPELYIYVNHGSNTWQRSHWEHNMLPYATTLSAHETQDIATRLMR